MFDRVVFSYGFRIFFLLAGLSAAVLVPVWVAMLQGVITPPGYFSATAWHGHELVFGFASAVVAGFLLTAAPNWTGVPAAKGRPLVILTAFWLAGRGALFFAERLPDFLVAAADLIFLPAVAAVLLPPLLKAGKHSNTAFAGLLGMMSVANLVLHLEALGLIESSAGALYAAIDLVVLVMIMVGGRITPAFTRNALGIQMIHRPAVDKIAISLVVLLMLADFAAAPMVAVGWIALAAALANAVRLAGWRTSETLKSPILWILHLAYAWIIMGFALRGVSALTDVMSMATALHGLTIGAVGSLTLGMMTRVALGHSGRPLSLRPAIPWAYAAVSLAAVVRIAGPLSLPELSLPANILAGLLWTLAFSIFLVIYAPILTSPRGDGRPG